MRIVAELIAHEVSRPRLERLATNVGAIGTLGEAQSACSKRGQILRVIGNSLGRRPVGASCWLSRAAMARAG